MIKVMLGLLLILVAFMVVLDTSTNWEQSSHVIIPDLITPTVEATATLEPTATPTLTPTFTPAPEPTETPRISVNTATPTPSLTPTKTASPRPLDTPVPTAVPETTEAMQLFEFHNSERIQRGLTPLIWDTQLVIVAEYRARDMASKQYFSHDAPDGKSWEYALNQIKYPYGYAGENIHMSRGYSVSQLAEVAHRGYMNSTGHRENILFSKYTHVGIAFAKDEKSGSHYNAVIFSNICEGCIRD